MQLNHILLFGAGKSASVLIDYLIDSAGQNNWTITVADADERLILKKTKSRPGSAAVQLDIQNEHKRKELIEAADLVISMMPPALHILIARDCIAFEKSLLTASYADAEILSLNEEVKRKGLIFLCEMGLDPGIDHMSAMKLMDDIRAKGGKITSFKSHCGGLVAPESDDNPWHYKISWNPRNVVLAGKAGAVYKENNLIVEEKYQALFDGNRKVVVDRPEHLVYGFYPNRNSLPYIDLYGLTDVNNFVRTTLRHPDFITGWNKIIALGLTDETPTYSSDNQSLQDFFSSFIGDKLTLLQNDPEQHLFMQQLHWLGLHDNTTLINKGICSAADVMQFALEQKLVLKPTDRDLIVMLHEITYELNQQRHHLNSTLLVKGDDQIHTGMAKTVGLPLGIAAKLLLNGTIQLTGVQIPLSKEIYEPVLKELEEHGIAFFDSEVTM
jgi:saccharopine dehydrogenase-like NADP-dependent oxidoreductase